MKPIDDGGSAFPMPLNETTSSCSPCGMSLRDEFAGMAMQGMAASQQWEQNFDATQLVWLSDVARTAYAAADAMLEARKKTS